MAVSKERDKGQAEFVHINSSVIEFWDYRSLFTMHVNKGPDQSCANLGSQMRLNLFSWVKVFRINPEFRILRLTFQSQPQNAELGR